LTVLSWLSCPGSPVIVILFCLSISACPVLAVAFRYSCSGCVLIWLAFSSCALLSVLLWLFFPFGPVVAALSWHFFPCSLVVSVQFCLSSSVCPVLSVSFGMCVLGVLVAVCFWLSCPAVLSLLCNRRTGIRKLGVRKYKREKTKNTLARNLRSKKDRESANAKEFRPGARKRKHSDQNSACPALETIKLEINNLASNCSCSPVLYTKHRLI
jgi:hypothetical protein